MSSSAKQTNSINDFAFKLYKQMVKKDENFFISPFSISMALQMCYVGAKENTAKQLRELLCLDDALSESEVLKMNNELLGLINNELNNDKLDINVANKLYPMVNFEIKKEFIDKMKSSFQTTIDPIDFSKNVEAAKTINQWVEDKTNSKIKDLIEPDLLDSLTRLVLVNAIYFKGTWATQFEKEQTQKQQFNVASNQEVSVDMMRLYNKKFRLIVSPKGLKCAACELPYIGDKLAMTILLPDKTTSIDELEAQLNSKILSEILAPNPTVGKESVNVYLPKFKLKYKSELSEHLIKLGASDAFDENKANFNGINERQKDELFISAVIHQAFVDVNEEGTEAAAATAVVMRLKRCAIVQKDPYDFICDRPFMFVLHEKKNDTILFMGKCLNPII